MEGEQYNSNSEVPRPILFIPRVCTPVVTTTEMSEQLLLHLNISTPDPEGNEIAIYKGVCDVKIMEGTDINIRYASPKSYSSTDKINVILAEADQIMIPAYNDAQVWIDPARSPYVYNNCDSPTLEINTGNEPNENHITLEQHNTYITQNVYNYESPAREEQNAVTTIQENGQNSDVHNLYEDEELECGVFLSQLSEEINEKNAKTREERNFIGLQTDNEALNQLMSTNIQTVSRQQKTILFLGHDSRSGQTVQNISINDPSLQCVGASSREVASKFTTRNSRARNNPRAKKYQCNKCKQMFDELSAFKQHVVGSHQRFASGNFKFMCTECGKNMKNQEKFAQHCLGHGDPDLECNKCHKVFASKFTLRNHRKIHSRMFPCTNCSKSFAKLQEYNSHLSKVHFKYTCEVCTYACETSSELIDHQRVHDIDETLSVQAPNKSRSNSSASSSTSELNAEDVFDSFEWLSDISVAEEIVKQEEVQDLDTPDSVIAKVIANNIFQTESKTNKTRNYNKTCEVCLKKFDRIGDLKRHLIEHMVRSTLAKNPVNKFGVLNIRCEICQERVFSKIDRYKAHLREHAKLTLYKCTFCDKSFSDSSNFSKHKKIHGTTYFQCDLCQRKFNTKKMIIQHMEYHMKNKPIKCQYCEKVFHFESMLNKHMRCSHINSKTNKFRCRFCRQYFRCLKEKWDHEWAAHKARKVIVDCLFCESRFRKYSELKRHCVEEHDTIVPPARKLLRWKYTKLRMV